MYLATSENPERRMADRLTVMKADAAMGSCVLMLKAARCGSRGARLSAGLMIV